jgi:hypothetical protein
LFRAQKAISVIVEPSASGARLMPPNFSISRAVLAAALVRLGRVEEAKAVSQAASECEPSFTVRGTLINVGFERAVFKPFASAVKQLSVPASILSPIGT